jgi:NitT/TauT family transport system substrate-binding protein
MEISVPNARIRLLGYLAASMCLLVLAAWLLAGRPPTPTAPMEELTIALPRQALVGAMFVAIDRGLFRQQGLNVINQPHELGIQALKSLLEQRADLAVVGDTPFMFKVMNGERIAIISAISSGRRSVALVARPTAGITAIADLAGKTVGLPIGTNMQFFLSELLLENHVPEARVKIVNLQQHEIVGALQEGRVDAVTAWQDNLAVLQKGKVPSVKFFYGERPFHYRLNLVARQDYIKVHETTLRKVLVGLEQAMQFIREHPDEAKAIVARYTGPNPATAMQFYDSDDFQLELDQAMLLSLDDQTRWAIKNGLVERQTVPNYLDYIYFDALQAVQPSAITVIH